MVVTKVVGGILMVSLANLAIARFQGSEPSPDLATRQALADACQAALTEHPTGLTVAPLDSIRLKQLGEGHYWLSFTAQGASGARPVRLRSGA